MNEQKIKSRLQLKTDTRENWAKASEAASPFIPKKGEPIVYQDGKISQLKIGNGVDTPDNLPAIGMDVDNEFSVSGELIKLEVDIEDDAALKVVSKIQRDETWGPSNKLVLHQVSGTNFVDLTSYLGGAGTVFEKSGVTATVNGDGTVTISGTNESGSSVSIIDKYNWEGEEVYPAGTYRIPNGLTMAVRAAQHPANVRISGAEGNLSYEVTIPEPFRIVWLYYSVKTNTTVNTTLPLGIFYGKTVPEADYEYNGQLHTVTFDAPIYEGEFNWLTGELKDADGNIVGYCEVPEINKLPGTNYFWTCFGENTISNVSGELNKVIIGLDETAPKETIPSICDFMLTPTTPEAAYGLYSQHFMVGGKFYGNEVPVLTTKGTLSVIDADGNVKYSKYVDPIFNSRGVRDVLSHKGLEKKWSKKFYLTKTPISVTNIPAKYDWDIDNDLFVWEFDESEFVNTGIPAKIHDIPIASPCFINNDTSETKVNTQQLYNGTPYPAFFSYNEETGKYTLTARGIQGWSISSQLTNYSKVHFYYQLETPYVSSFTFAMGIDAGDRITFDVDLSDNQPYIDTISYFKDHNVNPSVTTFVPRNVEDAMDGMKNAASIFNRDTEKNGGDATAQGYSWIGEGDGVTDYTVQIQTKLDELHRITNGGTIHLGPGTYPISKSLIVYSNTRIIGDGRTCIEQKSDNTHAVVISGSHITIRDMNIRLSGKCTEFTACIYTNTNNTDLSIAPNLPANEHCQFCTIENVQLYGNYKFSFTNGLGYIPDDVKNYRGVGIHGLGYFNLSNVDITAHNLFSAVYGSDANNCYQITGMYIGYSVYAIGGGQNIYDVSMHTYYTKSTDGNEITLTKSAVYAEKQHNCHYTVRLGDPQYSDNLIHFNTDTMGNTYCVLPMITASTNSPYEGNYGTEGGVRCRANVIDKGRGNINVTPTETVPFLVGNRVEKLNGIGVPNMNAHGSMDNILSGAGVWGNISSNVEWSENGIALRDICRYPKEEENQYSSSKYLSVVSKVSPSVDSPVEIVIDISNRPIYSFPNLWIQFDHKYVAEDIQLSFDTTGDGNFNFTRSNIIENTNTVFWYADHQAPQMPIYRIKIAFTKAYSEEGLRFQDTAHVFTTLDYNPNGLVGIVNIGMMHREPFGRAFLGECGGSLYGDVDMHQNTLRNLPAPVESGDAVNKSYVEECISNLPTYEGTYREIYGGEMVDEA